MTTPTRIDGTWTLVIGTPRGDRPATLHLTQDGATVTGTMNDIPIQDGTCQANELTFSAQLTVPIKIKVRCSVRIDGDTMTGAAKAGVLPITAPISGRRVAS
jgi:hypothetical protein